MNQANSLSQLGIGMFCLFLATNAKAQTAKSNPSPPLAYVPAPANNPLKGFVPYLRADSSFPHSLEWDYSRLSDIMTGPTNFNWAPFEAKLNAAAQHFEVSLAVTNTGVAPFDYDWPVELGLLDVDGKMAATWRTHWKLTGIRPGDPVAIWRWQTHAPSLPANTGHLLLRVPNSLPNGPPLRFAHQSQDQHQPGWLTLGKFQKP